MERTVFPGKRFDEAFEKMPWEAVDTVVFDIGRVLIHYTPDSYVKILFPGDEQKQQDILTRIYNSPLWPDLDRGIKDQEEVSRLVTAEFGGDPADYMKAMLGWCELVVLLEEGWRVVQKCREQGKKIYLLSNYNGECFARLLKKFPEEFSIFDGRCVSYESHQMKPEPEIYNRLIDTFHLNPNRTLFLDDVLENINGAMACGINGFHFNKAGKADAYFE